VGPYARKIRECALLKYLYGKKSILTPLVEGEAGFRFSDLSHYARMENELMRDDEMSKTFIIDRFSGELSVNGRVISPEDMTQDLKLTIPTRHCYCLCLSSRKNCDELFDKFKADICIEVNVDLLVEFLKDFFSHKFQGMQVIARNITYYSKGHFPKACEVSDLVFYKPDAFNHEAEFRIALFYPLNKLGFKAIDGKILPFKDDNESMHITFAYPDKEFLKQFIGNTFERKA
jgi:hypothetical protein